MGNEKQKSYHFISIANYTLAKFHSGNEENKRDAFKLRGKYFYRGDNPSPWVQYINNEIAQIKQYLLFVIIDFAKHYDYKIFHHEGHEEHEGKNRCLFLYLRALGTLRG